jgi:hypothetical protein
VSTGPFLFLIQEWSSLNPAFLPYTLARPEEEEDEDDSEDPDDNSDDSSVVVPGKRKRKSKSKSSELYSLSHFVSYGSQTTTDAAVQREDHNLDVNVEHEHDDETEGWGTVLDGNNQRSSSTSSAGEWTGAREGAPRCSFFLLLSSVVFLLSPPLLTFPCGSAIGRAIDWGT